MKVLSVVRISILNALMTALLFSGQAIADIPSETYKALGVSKSASPKELYGKLKERYLDPEQGAGKGSLAEYWEPIPMSAYLDPLSFYKPNLYLNLQNHNRVAFALQSHNLVSRGLRARRESHSRGKLRPPIPYQFQNLTPLQL